MESTDQRKGRFEGLFREHYDRVHRYALRRSSAAAADEVTSETFAIAWRRLDDIPGEELPWLLGVARRTLANLERSERRQKALRATLIQQVPDPAASQTFDHPILHALAALGETDREALLLVAWEGLAPREAANVLACSLPAFHLRTFRARRRLRQALEQQRTWHRQGAENVLPVKELK